MFRALRYGLIAILALLCLQGAVGLVVPPYSDQELARSIVDTWEVNAYWTLMAIGFSAFVAFCSALPAFWGYERATRTFARWILALSVSAAVLAYTSHAALSVRVTHLTGQTFSRGHGLF
jgi:hypothetical protein